MYAVAFNGSPRKGGNTQHLLEATLKPLAMEGWETELVQVGGKNIRGCIACGKCIKNQDGRCGVKGDIANDCIEKMARADAIIIGSPTYFAGVASDIKALIDRSGFVAHVNGGLFAGKIGAAVVAVRRGGATHVYDTINHMFQMSRMVLPGSTYWNMGYGLDKGEVADDAEGLANMQNLGEMIGWVGNALAPVMKSVPQIGGATSEEA
ncbi:flavodoxin family protein [Desulfovibrio ferrophilus]|uniref:NADPH-dependent FMN reductase n=1 Tax=Desulfovibrio ferrophilus TaxID=241368 RepID=A0A2Z6AWS2_9BACT|nr:flavodoxin family protein [Desulfovibrio ferrophilus]BBD07655.1 NADPH-dependent FMN reductase [Desulfovibrio ferrophilus]